MSGPLRGLGCLLLVLFELGVPIGAIVFWLRRPRSASGDAPGSMGSELPTPVR